MYLNEENDIDLTLPVVTSAVSLSNIDIVKVSQPDNNNLDLAIFVESVSVYTSGLNYLASLAITP